MCNDIGGQTIVGQNALEDLGVISKTFPLCMMVDHAELNRQVEDEADRKDEGQPGQHKGSYRILIAILNWLAITTCVYFALIATGSVEQSTALFLLGQDKLIQSLTNSN